MLIFVTSFNNKENGKVYKLSRSILGGN